MTDTVVCVSRAASRPLPAPPPGSVWERVEQARRDDDLSYHALSRLAGQTGGHYRLIGTRQKWKAEQETVDRFIGALVAQGYSEQWLRAGVGTPRSQGSPKATAAAITDEVREEATEILVKHGRKLRRAEQAVNAILGYEPARGSAHGEIDAERLARFAAALLDEDDRLGRRPPHEMRLEEPPKKASQKHRITGKSKRV